MTRKSTTFLGVFLVLVIVLVACGEKSDLTHTLTLAWNGLDEFSGSELHTMLEQNPPRPLFDNPDPGSTTIDADGSASIVVDVLSERDYALYYYVDHNGNGTYDQDEPVDLKRSRFIPDEVEEMVIGYTSNLETPSDVCEYFNIPAPVIEPDGGDSSSDVPLALRWTGLEEFGNVMINARLTMTDGYKIGPYQTHYERGRGRAEVPQEFVTDFKWTILVWMDVDGTFFCNDDSTDIVREYNIPLGAREFTMGYDSSLDTRGDSISARMFGDSNYDPPTKSE